MAGAAPDGTAGIGVRTHSSTDRRGHGHDLGAAQLTRLWGAAWAFARVISRREAECGGNGVQT